jgi:hypothetical protein
MARREIDMAVLQVLVETGEIKRRDASHLWIFKRIENRTDNLVCAAVV